VVKEKLEEKSDVITQKVKQLNLFSFSFFSPFYFLFCNLIWFFGIVYIVPVEIALISLIHYSLFLLFYVSVLSPLCVRANLIG
jgi:hypothetical protein